MDFADTINQLSAHMEGMTWRIRGLVSEHNLNGFKMQDTDMPLLPVEYVRQLGDADYGFHGTCLFPTTYQNGDGGVMLLEVEFHD